jgi:hypothetical protein
MEPDGGGFTLALKAPGLDNADPGNWSASRFPGGTPGHVNSYAVPVLDRIRAVPERFALHPVYPNPFNASATIRFDLPTRCRITVSVYDLRGRRITVLADGEWPEGAWSVKWTAPDVASGVYLCRLDAPAGPAPVRLVRKMALVK